MQYKVFKYYSTKRSARRGNEQLYLFREWWIFEFENDIVKYIKHSRDIN
jgi:hypothetical protein